MTRLRFATYALISALCVVVNFLVMVGGERAGIHFAASTTVSFVLCVALGYTLHSRFTFAAPLSPTGLLRYTTAMSLNYPLSILAVWFFYKVLTLPMVAAAPASTLALTLYNFLSSRWAIGRGTRRDGIEKATHEHPHD